VAAADPPSWQLVPSPNPSGTQYAQLTSVSCVSSSDCTAVGYWENAGVQQPLIETWDGSSWQLASAPNPSGSYDATLTSVSCSGPSACTAVGSWLDAPSPSDSYQPLIETWDGTSWQIVSAPLPTSPGTTGVEWSNLQSVSCPSATSCTAVGQYDDPNGLWTLVESWNGTSWQIVASPNPSLSLNGLGSVSCVSATNCTAVGYYNNPITVELPLAEVWNGTSWSVVASPLPSGSSQGYLGSVSCVSSSFCMATGAQTEGTSNQSFVEVWNGISWQEVASPNPGPGSVSCVSSSDCTAPSTDSSSLLTWDGTTWQSVPAALSPTGNPVNLFGVSCLSASECTAVGIQSSGEANLTLVESTTTSQPTPQLPETPLTIALPVLALGLFGGVFVALRRRSNVKAV